MKKIKSYFYGLSMLLVIFCFFCGCSGTEVGNPEAGEPTPTIQLSAFASDEELENYLKAQYAAGALAGELYNIGPEADSTNVPADAGGFSGTNLQEAGVDEGDVVKTDGTVFYMSRGNAVSVVNAAEPMEEVARLTMDGYVSALYLYESTLVVLYTPSSSIGRPWDVVQPPTDALVGMPYWIPVRVATGVAFFDVTDPADPRALKKTVFDGRMVSSRIANGRLHLVQQFLPDLPQLTLWHDGTQQGRDKAVEDNRQAIAALTLDQLLPHVRYTDGDGTPMEERIVVAGNLYHPDTKDGGGSIATVVTFNLDDPGLAFDTIGVVADVHVVYASKASLYMLAHRFVPPRDLAGSYTQQLAIQKFDLSGEKVTYTGGGRIDGWVLNQFSLGEYQGVLRVALSTSPWGPAERRANHIKCVKVADGKLEVIGKLENLAPGESIYAARFIGTRGYLVTFVKVDPLFTIDLSDPTQPRLAGELKVPGYADYIHPYGDNHLITVGKEALSNDSGTWYQGMQMSIFDITDFDNPQLRHKVLIGDRGTESEALHNHKAFTFWASQELLAIPVRLFEHQTPPAEPWHSGVNVFNGLLVYRTSVEDGFEPLGRLGDDRFPDVAVSYWSWLRGIFSGPTVYAVSPDRIQWAETERIDETIQAWELPALP